VVVLATHVCQGAGMVGGLVHVAVQILLEVPVVGRIADDQDTALRRQGK
jgi:hypothetical protein